MGFGAGMKETFNIPVEGVNKGPDVDGASTHAALSLLTSSKR